jgi:hypothetical protein
MTDYTPLIICLPVPIMFFLFLFFRNIDKICKKQSINVVYDNNYGIYQVLPSSQSI